MLDDELVLKSNLQELKDFMIQQMSSLTNEIRSVSHHIEGVEKRVSTLIGRVQQLETAPPKMNENKEDDDEDVDDVVYDSDGLVDERLTLENKMCKRLQKNKTGMGGTRHQ
jgi:predicted  nucleic acid-binding Zn-ribbon protein